MTHVVAALDVLDPVVRQEILRVAPQELSIEFANTYERAEQMALAAKADFILAGWAQVTSELIDSAPQLKLIQVSGVGTDNIDVIAARSANVPVAIAAGCNSSPVAECAVMLMLAVYRRLTTIDSAMRRGIWMKAEMRARCLQLRDKTVGILGFGNIGQMVARKLSGFEVNTIYHDLKRQSPEVESELAVTYAPFDELLRTCDILTIHMPWGQQTEKMIGKEAIAQMKSSAVIINTARGMIVDEDALCAAIQEKRLFGAGIDAWATEPPPPDHPLLTMDEVVVMPHTAGAVLDNVENVAAHAFRNMLTVLRGEPLISADVVTG